MASADQFRPTPPVNPAYYGPTPPSLAVPRKPKRVFMWFFLAVQALFLIWIIGGGASASTPDPGTCGSLSAQTCADAAAVGTGIGVMLIIGLWVALDLILGIARLVVITSRKKAV